jgi:hypothetical protein
MTDCSTSPSGVVKSSRWFSLNVPHSPFISLDFRIHKKTINVEVQVHAQSTRVRSAHLNNTTLYKCINRLDIIVRPKAHSSKRYLRLSVKFRRGIDVDARLAIPPNFQPVGQLHCQGPTKKNQLKSVSMPAVGQTIDIGRFVSVRLHYFQQRPDLLPETKTEEA